MTKSDLRKAGLLMAGLLLLAGCDTRTENRPAKAEAVKINPAGVFPVTDRKITLSVLAMSNNRVENYATNEFTKWLEEKTNIHLNWEVVPNVYAEERLNVILASGNYPDVLLGFPVSPIQQALFGKDGVFRPLNSYIQAYGKETKRMFAEVPYAKPSITLTDGAIYALPLVNECYHCQYGAKMWVNRVWLDRLGLNIPQTTEQFYEMLKAFKERDPNGNGLPDEIPLSGAVNGPSTRLDLFLMNSFVESDFQQLFVEQGRVKAAFVQPGWKEGIRYLRKLTAEGLLLPKSFTQDRFQLKLQGDNPGTTILGAVAAQNPNIFVSGNYNRWKSYVTIPPLRGPGGLRSAKYNPDALLQGAFIITDKAKHPEAAFRLADLLYSEEAAFRGLVGRPGKEWTMAEPGEKGIDGNPAKWKQLLGLDAVQNITWSQTGPSYRSEKWRFSMTDDPLRPMETLLYRETKNNYEPYRMDPSKSVPTLIYTSTQAEAIANVRKAVNEYRDEAVARMVLSDGDLDTEWAGYLETMKRIGLDRYLQAMQEAYNAQPGMPSTTGDAVSR